MHLETKQDLLWQRGKLLLSNLILRLDTPMQLRNIHFSRTQNSRRGHSLIYYAYLIQEAEPEYYDTGETYRECLLNAALTCKEFLDVALDTLWEELDSFVPLLKVLPALQVEGNAYVCANAHVFLCDLILLLGT